MRKTPKRLNPRHQHGVELPRSAAEYLLPGPERVLSCIKSETSLMRLDLLTSTPKGMVELVRWCYPELTENQRGVFTNAHRVAMLREASTRRNELLRDLAHSPEVKQMFIDPYLHLMREMREAGTLKVEWAQSAGYQVIEQIVAYLRLMGAAEYDARVHADSVVPLRQWVFSWRLSSR